MSSITTIDLTEIDKGSSAAQYTYAGYVEEGIGVDQDLSLAAHYDDLAMGQGEEEADEGYERCRQSAES
jgi:TPR repeat protein